mmetsp:Transcript_1143/g.2199  ORF Transcript_1143/g.2199 Transcript_1143/m.2199 type:complete len:141 (-) Transcript_1143:763-1185(-)
MRVSQQIYTKKFGAKQGFLCDFIMWNGENETKDTQTPYPDSTGHPSTKPPGNSTGRTQQEVKQERHGNSSSIKCCVEPIMKSATISALKPTRTCDEIKSGPEKGRKNSTEVWKSFDMCASETRTSQSDGARWEKHVNRKN